jgi:hypothetical protein
LKALSAPGIDAVGVPFEHGASAGRYSSTSSFNGYLRRGKICTLLVLAERLWASHKPQPHEVMAVQEPASDQQVAAVQPKKETFKKKTNGGISGSGSSVGGASSHNGGVLSHAEQARVGSSLCLKHFCYGAAARGCIKPCSWLGN